jgi:hypothetical protein
MQNNGGECPLLSAKYRDLLQHVSPHCSTNHSSPAEIFLEPHQQPAFCGAFCPGVKSLRLSTFWVSSPFGPSVSVPENHFS